MHAAVMYSFLKTTKISIEATDPSVNVMVGSAICIVRLAQVLHLDRDIFQASRHHHLSAIEELDGMAAADDTAVPHETTTHDFLT